MNADTLRASQRELLSRFYSHFENKNKTDSN